MTTGGWIMLGITWAIIIFFTSKFFIMVVKTPSKDD